MLTDVSQIAGGACKAWVFHQLMLMIVVVIEDDADSGDCHGDTCSLFLVAMGMLCADLGISALMLDPSKPSSCHQDQFVILLAGDTHVRIVRAIVIIGSIQDRRWDDGGFMF